LNVASLTPGSLAQNVSPDVIAYSALCY